MRLFASSESLGWGSGERWGSDRWASTNIGRIRRSGRTPARKTAAPRRCQQSQAKKDGAPRGEGAPSDSGGSREGERSTGFREAMIQQRELTKHAAAGQPCRQCGANAVIETIRRTLEPLIRRADAHVLAVLARDDPGRARARGECRRRDPADQALLCERLASARRRGRDRGDLARCAGARTRSKKAA